jgi:hypothetical protein
LDQALSRRIADTAEEMRTGDNALRDQMDVYYGRNQDRLQTIEKYLPETMKKDAIADLIQQKVHFSQDDLEKKVNSLAKSTNKQI